MDIDSAKSFSQKGEEKTVQDIISKLRFISKIQPGEKINIKERFVRDNSQIWQRIIRTIRNITYEDAESKDATLKFLEMVTDEAINLIVIYKSNDENSFNINVANLIISNLETAITGMESLINTYSQDRNFTTRVEALMGTLTLKLGTLKDNGIIIESD